MEKLTRETGIRCPHCKWSIIEGFTFHSRNIGNTALGGRNSSESWVDSKFYCMTCGMVFEPTGCNELVPFDKTKVSKILKYGNHMFEFKRDLNWNDIFQLDPISTEITNLNFRIGEKTIELRGEFDSHLNERYTGDLGIKQEEVFLICKFAEHPILLDRTKGKLYVPKKAVPATKIKILNNNFDIHEYWVPTDSLVLLKS